MSSYWKKQTPETPLFPDIEWSKPERRDLAGRLAIIGGNSGGFAGVAEAYSTSLHTGAGRVRILVPDTLKKTIPPTISDTIFTHSTPSGGIAKTAIADMRALAAWSTGVLLIGDSAKSSETAIAFEQLLADYDGTITITRDAIDLLLDTGERLVTRENTVLIGSFAHMQKLFRSVYYPKMLTFSMQLAHAVDALHTFTISYPVTLATLHQDTLLVAHGGTVTTTPFTTPLALWRGTIPAKMSTYLLWTPHSPLEALTTSVACSRRMR